MDIIIFLKYQEIQRKSNDFLNFTNLLLQQSLFLERHINGPVPIYISIKIPLIIDVCTSVRIIKISATLDQKTSNLP